jgi:hypothetical protein
LKNAVCVILVVLSLAVSGTANAATGDASFAFLRIAVGSRPASLAEAVTASGRDITSAYYNPALLNSINARNQVAFMYNSYFEDVTQNYLAFGSKRKNYAVGGYLVLGGVPDFERRVQPSPEPIGTFDENYFVGSLAYARPLGIFDFGLGLKYAYEKIDYETASSIMLDAGLYAALTDEISAGGAIKNLGTEPKFRDISYPLSQEFRLGLAYRPMVLNRYLEFMVDGVFYSDLDPKYNFGVEYSYKNYFALRTGYGAGYDSRGLSFGGGVMYRQFNFDYAFVSYKNDLGNAHRFTITASF